VDGLLDSQLLLARAGLRQHDERKRASQLAASQFPTSATDGFRLATVGLGQRQTFRVFSFMGRSDSSEAETYLKHGSLPSAVSSWIAPTQCSPLTTELPRAEREDGRHHPYRRAPFGSEIEISPF